MKEVVALTKQCPILKGQRPNETHCVGSDCMMWESWEWEKRNPEPKGVPRIIIMCKGEGDCGLRTKEACHEI
jgi:hypothetical protein